MNDQTNTAAPEFNIAAFEARDTAWLDVQNIKDDGPLLHNGQPVRIEIRSPGTKEAMNAQHKAEVSNNAKTFAALRGKVTKDTVDTGIAARAERLEAVTAQIENFPITAKALYTNPKLGWITAQAEKFANDWANF